MAYKRSYAFIGTFATIVLAMLVPITFVIREIADFARTCLKIDHGVAWRVLREFPVMAFLKIGEPMPVYRESYATHGLSLDLRRRC